MEKEFIPYKQSLALKELGFNEECFGYFSAYFVNSKTGISKLYIDANSILDNNQFIKNSTRKNILCASPLYQQAFRWFREKYDLCGYIVTAPNYIKGESNYKTRFSYEIYGMNEKSSSTVFITIRDVVNLSTYEEAELECLKKLIEIVKL